MNNIMPVFDCHVHIDNDLSAYDLKGVKQYNIIFNSIDSYLQHKINLPHNSSVSLIFDWKNNLDFVLNEIESNRVQVLKFHSRIQKIKKEEYTVFAEKLNLVNPSVPVIIDAFYFGAEMEFQPCLESIISVIKKHPQRKFIIAHSGGYEVLKYFFHLREIKNVYYDLSLSLQYLNDTSRYQDLIKLIKYTDKTKLLFGSDYHYGSPKQQLNYLLSIFDQLSISDADQQNILYNNSKQLFG